MDLAHSMFSTLEMATAFSSDNFVRYMLAVEAALAGAEARAGVIPAAAAETIRAACQAERFDVDAILREAAPASTPAIPLVRLLTERVQGEARRYVHWGATSQDVIDTALVLQMRDGFHVLLPLAREVAQSCARLAEQHRRTVMPARTLLQQALPITFGLKAARWLALVTRQIQALHLARQQALVVQFGGAAGTLASLGDKGIQVQELLAEELGLAVPDLPWHAERDRVAAAGATLGILAGCMAKIAEDVVLLAQTEVGEASEAVVEGKGGSSALPQKRNPVDAMEALAAARLATGLAPLLITGLAQEHERAVGAWQAEWAVIPDLFCYTAGAVDRVRSVLAGVQIDAGRMRANLDLAYGLIMSESLTSALADHVGRAQAYAIVQDLTKRAVAEHRELREVASQDERVTRTLSPDGVSQALDPASYLGSTNAFIDRALDAFREVGAEIKTA